MYGCSAGHVWVVTVTITTAVSQITRMLNTEEFGFYFGDGEVEKDFKQKQKIIFVS